MADKRQKAAKVKCKHKESLTKQSMFVEIIIVFSRRSIWVLRELVGRSTQHFTKIDQKTRKNWTNLYLEPHDYWTYYVNIGLHHQYGISAAESQTFLLAKRPRQRRAMRNGCFRRLKVNNQYSYSLNTTKFSFSMFSIINYCVILHNN